MDPLRRDDIERARRLPIEERAKLALEMMRTGIKLKRASLRARYPEASESEIEEKLLLWLRREG